MQVGDLVTPNDVHVLYTQSWRSHGIVIEHHAPRKGFNECVVVQWNNGDIELDIPGWLEVLSEGSLRT